MNNSTRQPVTPAARASADLALSFACPECGHLSWVTWQQLGHGVRCAACQRWFTLDRQGQLVTGTPIRQFQFKCPRCGEAGTLPATRLAQGAKCRACSLTLLPGPDQQLHDQAEILALQRESRRTAQDRREQARRAFQGPHLPRWCVPRRRRAWLVFALAGGLLLLAIGACRFAGPASGESLARRFTTQLLAGEWDEAATQVAEFQEDDFRRWRILHFASIRDAFRPAGDRVRVEVEPVQDTPAQRTLRVTLTSAFLGQRTHVQCWRNYENHWVFDAAASLASDR